MRLKVYLISTAVSLACSSIPLMFYKLYQGSETFLKNTLRKEEEVGFFKIM